MNYLANFNKLPEATKDGRDSAMQVLEQEILEVRQVAFGELAVSAGWCHKDWTIHNFWWGVRNIMNVCKAQEVSWQFAEFSAHSALIGMGMAFVPSSHFGAALLGIMSAYKARIGAQISYFASMCSIGVTLNLLVWTYYYKVNARCK